MDHSVGIMPVELPMKMKKQVSFSDQRTVYIVPTSSEYDRESVAPDPYMMQERYLSRQNRIVKLRNKLIFGKYVNENDSTARKLLKRVIPNVLWKRINSNGEEDLSSSDIEGDLCLENVFSHQSDAETDHQVDDDSDGECCDCSQWMELEQEQRKEERDTFRNRELIHDPQYYLFV
jgi:hypothetical protein